MDLHFVQPGFLWIAAAIPILWVWPRRVRHVAHGLARSAVWLLLAIALAQPVTLHDDARPHHVFVLDRSPSVPADLAARFERRLHERAEALAADSEVSILFLGRPTTLEWPTSIHTRDLPTDGDSPLPSALAIALGSIPDGAAGAVTLASDGRSTDPEWIDTLATYSAREVPLHTVDLAKPDGDTYPSRVRLPETLRVGETVTAWLEGVAHGDAATPITATIHDADGRLTRAETTPDGGRFAVRLDFEPRRAGFVDLEFSVEVDPANDARPDNNTLTRRVAVQDPTRVLYLGGRVDEAAPEIGRLVGSGFEIRTAESVTPATLAESDLVILDDRPADALPDDEQELLTEAVREGQIGLFMSGGSASFGGGGYHRTPLEEILPVEFIQKEEKKDPSTALAIIIDTSGSMSGNRIVLAKEVTRLAIRRLLPHDKVGIVEFFGNKRWAAPLQSAANAIDIQRALNRLDAGGGTILLPAIEEAYYGLRNVQTRYKHVLVLTDAGVETGPYETLLRRMARDGICVSTILVGPERHSEFLVQLADWGNGRYYNASNRFSLPEIMLKQPSTALLPSYRPGRHTVETRGGRRWWKDVDPGSVPPLAGYVESKARPGAEVPLRTAKDRHPVVATWNYGLGRVTTFLTEPAGPGTEMWRYWPGFGPFLGRLLERTGSNLRSPFRFWTERHGSVVDVWAERVVPTDHDPEGQARFESGDAIALEFTLRAPDLFRARIDLPPTETLELELGTVGLAHATVRRVSDASRSHAPETQVDPDAAIDLAKASERTGGIAVPSSDNGATSNAWPDSVSTARSPIGATSLAPHAFLLALALYLADLVLRRRARR